MSSLFHHLFLTIHRSIPVISTASIRYTHHQIREELKTVYLLNAGLSSRQSWLCLSLCSFTFLSFLPLFSLKLMNPKVTLISVTSEQKIRTLALYEHRSQTFALIFLLLRQRLLLFPSLEMRREDKRIHSGDENEGCFSHRLQWRFSSLLCKTREKERESTRI